MTASDPRSRRGWSAASRSASPPLLFVVAPAVLSPFRLDLLAKFLCFAIVAVGHRAGLGPRRHADPGPGRVLRLGAYLMAMHLKLADAGPGGDCRTSWADRPRTAARFWEPFGRRS